MESTLSTMNTQTRRGAPTINVVSLPNLCASDERVELLSLKLKLKLK
jgi:hypothetical protein